MTTIELHGPEGTAVLEALVDTGATFTKISKGLASKVGLKPRRSVLTQVVIGEFISRNAGAFEGELEGVRDMMPVVIGEDHEPSVIGLRPWRSLASEQTQSQKDWNQAML